MWLELARELGLETAAPASPEDMAAQVNREMRTTADFVELYMPFDSLLFFGAEVNSDLFGFRILGGTADDMDVFVWEHETDSRTATAAGLERYVRGERWHERL